MPSNRVNRVNRAQSSRIEIYIKVKSPTNEKIQPPSNCWLSFIDCNFNSIELVYQLILFAFSRPVDSINISIQSD